MTKKMHEKRFLLDVNILVSLAQRWNAHHQRARTWMELKGRSGIATCPLTQLGFLRIVTSPSFSSLSLDVPEAHRLLNAITSLPHHEFWPDDLSASSLNLSGVRGHKQWNDAYLLALAKQRNGIVATFDKGFAELARAQQSPIELLNQ